MRYDHYHFLKFIVFHRTGLEEGLRLVQKLCGPSEYVRDPSVKCYTLYELDVPTQCQTYCLSQLLHGLRVVCSDSVSNLFQRFAVRQVLQDLRSEVKPAKTESTTVSAVTAMMVELVNFQL